MVSRPLPSLVFAALTAASPGWAQDAEAEDATPIPEVTAPAGSIFTDEEIAAARAVAVENRERRETYIRNGEDEDIVVLEPYIVEGDRSLLMARLRRELERRPHAIRSSLLARDPNVQRDLALARRAEDAFFTGPSPGAPADHVNTGVDMLRAPGAVIAAWRNRDLGSLVRAPDPVTGQ